MFRTWFGHAEKNLKGKTLPMAQAGQSHETLAGVKQEVEEAGYKGHAWVEKDGEPAHRNDANSIAEKK